MSDLQISVRSPWRSRLSRDNLRTLAPSSHLTPGPLYLVWFLGDGIPEHLRHQRNDQNGGFQFNSRIRLTAEEPVNYSPVCGYFLKQVTATWEFLPEHLGSAPSGFSQPPTSRSPGIRNPPEPPEPPAHAGGNRSNYCAGLGSAWIPEGLRKETLVMQAWIRSSINQAAAALRLTGSLISSIDLKVVRNAFNQTV